jgi:hypothetical protein
MPLGLGPSGPDPHGTSTTSSAAKSPIAPPFVVFTLISRSIGAGLLAKHRPAWQVGEDQVAVDVAGDDNRLSMLGPRRRGLTLLWTPCGAR